MPTPSYWFDANNSNLKQELENLPRVPGYCVFLDITGSTDMKQKGILHWSRMIHNCFANASLFMVPFVPLKSIGDALVYYIEEVDLVKSGYTPMQIFDGLWQIANDADPEFPEVKIGAARCSDVYALTYFRGQQDYYGVDIDMTARLQHEASASRQIVIERRFHDAIRERYEAAGNREQFDESVLSLTGPEEVKLKGVPGRIEVFRSNPVRTGTQ